MGINVKTVAQFAKLFAGKSTGVAGGKAGKHMITYMKYGDEITKTLARADGHTITAKFKQVGGKWRAVNAVQQNANGVINTDLMGYGIKATTVTPAANPNFSVTRFSSPFDKPTYTMTTNLSQTQANEMIYNGTRLGILNYKG